MGGGIPFCCCLYCPPTCGWWHSVLLLPVLSTHVWVVAFPFIVAMYCPPMCGWWHSLLLLPCTVHPRVGGGIPFCCCYVLSTVHPRVGGCIPFCCCLYCPPTCGWWHSVLLLPCTAHCPHTRTVAMYCPPTRTVAMYCPPTLTPRAQVST